LRSSRSLTFEGVPATGARNANALKSYPQIDADIAQMEDIPVSSASSADAGFSGKPTYNFTFLNRNAFPITVTELNVIAALAIIGLSSNPKKGYSTPAAMGTPRML